MHSNDQTYWVTGTVKWFDKVRGFGFAVSDSIDQDILIHASVLKKVGMSNIAEGTELELEIILLEKGAQAVEIRLVVPNTASILPDLEGFANISEHVLDAMEWQPARIKWYSDAKGYGFCNVFNDSEDVFIHAEVLRHFGFGDPNTGDAVAVKVHLADRGKIVCAIRSWYS